MKDILISLFWIVGSALALWGAYILLASQGSSDSWTIIGGWILTLSGILTIAIILWIGDNTPVTEAAPR